MKIQLIKLKEGNILVSNKQPVKGFYFDTNINKVRNTSEADYAIDKTVKQIIASDFHSELPNIDYNGLEEKLGIIDIKKLGEKSCGIARSLNPALSETLFLTIFKEGFEKAQSLNKKQFSLEEVIDFCMTAGYSLPLNQYDRRQYITKALQQPKTFNVEIEMEKAPFENEDNSADMSYMKPKVVNNNIKILKLV